MQKQEETLYPRLKALIYDAITRFATKHYITAKHNRDILLWFSRNIDRYYNALHKATAGFTQPATITICRKTLSDKRRCICLNISYDPNAQLASQQLRVTTTYTWLHNVLRDKESNGSLVELW